MTETLDTARPPKGLYLAFFSLLLIFGVAFLVIIPPFQAPDEFNHFERAYAISELDFFSSRHPLPVSVEAVMAQPRQLVTDAALRVPFGSFAPMLSTALEPGKRQEINYFAATLYPPLIYLPQALGIAAARAFFPNTGVIYYFGRLFNLLAWALLGYLALRILPGFHWLFFLLLFMPMAFFLAVSLSPDVTTVGLSLLMAALVLRLASDCVSKIGWREVGWLAMVFALVALTKAPYFLLSLVYFILPWQKFGSRKEYFQKTASVFLLVMAAVLVAQGPALIQNGAIRQETAYAPPQQMLEQALQNPLWFAKMMARTFAAHAFGYPSGYIGQLGWLDTPLPLWIYALYPLAIVASLAGGTPLLRLSWLQKGLGLAISLGIVAAIHLLLYVSYTAPGSATIEGVQGRYFLPFGPLPYLVFQNRLLAKKQALLWLVPGVVAVVLAATAVTILKRYYTGF